MILHFGMVGSRVWYYIVDFGTVGHHHNRHIVDYRHNYHCNFDYYNVGPHIVGHRIGRNHHIVVVLSMVETMHLKWHF